MSNSRAKNVFLLSINLSWVLFFLNVQSKAQPARASADQKGCIVDTTPTHLDRALYDTLMRALANGDTKGYWPLKSTPYPLPGAILPFKRIVAYYGNLYSKNMGILGALPPKAMLAKLSAEVKNWEQADTTTPVQAALHYICVTAQKTPGFDGLYRSRMPFSQIDSVLALAKGICAIVLLDLQIGHSTLQNEIPRLEKYLKLPHVHLGIDPEFALQKGRLPGRHIGSLDASVINYASVFLSNLVRQYNLPPKILVVHRFTKSMLTNAQKIQLRPEVQFVMNMDGFGPPYLKKDSYNAYIYLAPVQFTGFKIFYKNDTKKKNGRLLTPREVLQLKPMPIYIQYQ